MQEFDLDDDVKIHSGNDNQSVYAMKSIISKVVDDVEKEVKVVLTTYKDELPKMLDYDEARKMKVFYGSYNDCIRVQEKIVDVMVKLDLVINQLTDIRETKLTNHVSNDFRELAGFRTWVDYKSSSLKTYRYDLKEVKKLIDDRIRLYQGLLYRGVDSK